jgi:CheY-like chemotaxis protein
MTMKRVLIIEDNSDLRGIFSLLFHHKHFEVCEATDGTEALEFLTHTVPDVIILDINMPKLSGLDVLKQIRQNPATAHTKVIVVTGNYLARQKPEAELADLFLVKPISIHELIVFAQRLLN